jgi:hypothetical protein
LASARNVVAAGVEATACLTIGAPISWASARPPASSIAAKAAAVSLCSNGPQIEKNI